MGRFGDSTHKDTLQIFVQQGVTEVLRSEADAALELISARGLQAYRLPRFLSEAFQEAMPGPAASPITQSVLEFIGRRCILCDDNPRLSFGGDLTPMLYCLSCRDLSAKLLPDDTRSCYAGEVSSPHGPASSCSDDSS